MWTPELSLNLGDGRGQAASFRLDDLNSVGESYPENYFRQLVVAIEATPVFLGGLGQLEDHGERGLVRETSFGAHCSVADRREWAFDGVGRSQMLPVLSREVVEGKQRVAILDQALDSLVVFDAPSSMKASNAARASFLVSAIQISWSARLAFDCWLLGSLFKTLAVLCTQQRWPRVLGHTSSTACQKPRAPSATASSGPIASPRRLRSRRSSFHDCALSRTPSMSPTSSFLPSGVAPMITSRHCAASSSRACTWMPSTQK